MPTRYHRARQSGSRTMTAVVACWAEYEGRNGRTADALTSRASGDRRAVLLAWVGFKRVVTEATATSCRIVPAASTRRIQLPLDERVLGDTDTVVRVRSPIKR